MKKLVFLFILLFAFNGYGQDQVLDKMELKNGKVYLGKVEKIKTDAVEFRETETDLVYESAKKDIRYIQLINGKILTFEDELKAEEKTDTQNTKEVPVVVQEAGAPVGLIILAAVGGVLLVLLLIGAAAQ